MADHSSDLYDTQEAALRRMGVTSWATRSVNGTRTTSLQCRRHLSDRDIETVLPSNPSHRRSINRDGLLIQVCDEPLYSIVDNRGTEWFL